MTSNIINMADKMSDNEDRLLKSLFAAKPIADDGFSDRVLRKLRLQLWVRRLTLPVAALIGFAVAVNPLLELLALMPSLTTIVPSGWSTGLSSLLPDAQMLVVGGMILIAGVGTLQLLDD